LRGDYRAIAIFWQKTVFFNTDNLFLWKKGLISWRESAIVFAIEIALSHGVAFGIDYLLLNSDY